MLKKGYEAIKILLAMENPSVRQGLQNALQSEGFPRAIEINTLGRMIAMLSDAPYDVILTATELADEFVPTQMTQLRQGNLGHHPVPIIMQFLCAAEQAYVRKTIDSGPDDILQMPISPAQLMTRLALLAENRKSFVVTSDYVGPDRRQGARPGAMVVPLLDVPNPMKMKINKLSFEDQAEHIARASDRLRAMRLARYVFELQWLLRAIKQLFEQGGQDGDKLLSFCERIKILLIGLPRLLPGGLPLSLEPTAARLEMGCTILMRKGFSADASILNGLSGVIGSLARALNDSLPADLNETAKPVPAVVADQPVEPVQPAL